jgi:hypothetical protein
MMKVANTLKVKGLEAAMNKPSKTVAPSRPTSGKQVVPAGTTYGPLRPVSPTQCLGRHRQDPLREQE